MVWLGVGSLCASFVVSENLISSGGVRYLSDFCCYHNHFNNGLGIPCSDPFHSCIIFYGVIWEITTSIPATFFLRATDYGLRNSHLQ